VLTASGAPGSDPRFRPTTNVGLPGWSEGQRSRPRGGAGLDFDSNGNLYLGVGDDVSPNAPGHNRYAPMDYRASERWDARKTSGNTADLRGKIVRIRPLDNVRPNAEPGLGKSYTVPAGNMFPQGMANTRPEIYAMGFRQPFTVHTDPAPTAGSGRRSAYGRTPTTCCA
jgi:hypothetical protein